MSHEAVGTLMALGLTFVQSKAYIVLATSNALTIETLSKRAKVPRTDLYRVVKELEQKGLVERIITAPVEFKAISLKEGINVLINRKNQENRELLEKAESILQSYSERASSEFTDNQITKFILVPHTRFLYRIEKAIDDAQKSVDILVSWSRFVHGTFLLQEKIEKSWSRKVKWRIITEKPENGESSLMPAELRSENPLCKVKFVSFPPKTIMSIYDLNQVFLIEQVKAGLSESPALWSNSKSLLALAEGYFEKLWDTARESTNRDPRKPEKWLKQFSANQPSRLI
jgi:sugar-specific transcriptional regulator TrmB